MAYAKDDRAILVQNLIDIGFDALHQDKILALLDTGKEREALLLIRRYRNDILENLHKCQNKMECLDYLVNSINKGEKHE